MLNQIRGSNINNKLNKRIFRIFMHVVGSDSYFCLSMPNIVFNWYLPRPCCRKYLPSLILFVFPSGFIPILIYFFFFSPVDVIPLPFCQASGRFQFILSMCPIYLFNYILRYPFNFLFIPLSLFSRLGMSAALRKKSISITTEITNNSLYKMEKSSFLTVTQNLFNSLHLDGYRKLGIVWRLATSVYGKLRY